MVQQVIKGTTKLSESIRRRRLELGLTIEEAASRAGVGTKTWCRYEAGESIRKDKAKGVCKAMNWHALPSDEEEEYSTIFRFSEYYEHEAWSEYICDNFGEAAAISFVIGSDILLDYLQEDLEELSKLPKGSHLGQLDLSMTKELLPEQFLMEYNYDFVYRLRITVERFRKQAAHNIPIIAHSVIQELALYLIVEEAEFLMESMSSEMEAYGIENMDTWKEWIFDLFDDMDIVTCLYSGMYLTNDHIYHFEHWMEEEFFT